MNLIIKQLVQPPDNQAIRCMSYNIRMAPNPEDDATENAWKHRLPKVCLILQVYKPDIAGVQEVSNFQMSSLQENLNDPLLEFLGKYPTKPPIESGLGIIYNTTKMTLISDLKTMWLNENRTAPAGPAWDGSNYERYVIYAKFKHKTMGKEFWFITTHFDHLGIKARQESAKIVMDLADTLDAPALITGDFNCFPQLGGQELYELLSTYSPSIKDSGTIAQSIFGVPGSWIGWDYDPYKQKDGFAKYDFVFVSDSIKVLQQGIIDDQVWDENLQKELYPSDHRPVICDVVI